MKEKLIAAVDMGTSKVCCIIAEEKDDDLMAIGMGLVPSRGLKKGVVINIEEASKAVREAFEKATSQANASVNEVVTGISGSHIEGLNSHGSVPLREDEVTQEDVDRVLDTAKAIKLENKVILHVLPQEFSIDSQTGILQPIGMTGRRLEVKAHIITASSSAVQNHLKCFTGAGLEVHAVILQALASAEAVLSNEEKELGVALVDFGGGTTDIAVFLDGSLRYTTSVPVGGEFLTTDLTMGLRTPKWAAEELKKTHGTCLPELVEEDESIEVPSLGDKPPKKISKRLLAEILEPRVQELLEIINAELEKSGFKKRLSSGVVITGGSALLKGLVEFAEFIFELPVRIGFPKRLSGLSKEVHHPRLSTAVGLVLYAQKYLYPIGGISKERKLLSKIKKLIGIGG